MLCMLLANTTNDCLFGHLRVCILCVSLAYSPRPVPMLRRVEGGPGPVMFDGAQQMNVAMIDTAGPPPKSELAPVTHVRKIFPETWLWKTLDTSYVARLYLFIARLIILVNCSSFCMFVIACIF